MNTVFFGARWDVPMLDDAVQVPTPVGQVCFQCGELVVDGERGLMRACHILGADGHPEASVQPVHAECDLMPVLSHLAGMCHCHGVEQDRNTARAVWAWADARRTEQDQ